MRTKNLDKESIPILEDYFWKSKIYGDFFYFVLGIYSYYFFLESSFNILFLISFFILPLFWKRVTFFLFRLSLFFLLGIVVCFIRNYSADYLMFKETYHGNLERGRILEVVSTGDKYKVLLGNLKFGNLKRENTPKYIDLYVTGNPVITKYIGKYISIRSIVVYPFQHEKYPGGYSQYFNKYYEGRAGKAYVSFRKVRILEEFEEKGSNFFLDSLDSFFLLISNLRINLSKKISSLTDNHNLRGFLEAIVIGNKELLTKNFKEDINFLGLGHILSISGLHFSVVVLFCFFLIRLFLSFSQRISLYYDNKKIAAFLVFPILILYLFLTGINLPTQRAFIMIFIVLLGVSFEKHNPFLTRSLLISVFLILLMAPEKIFSLSLQLSFFITFLIIQLGSAEKPLILESRPLSTMWSYFCYFNKMFVVNFGASLLFSYYLKRIYLHSFFVNLFLIPFFSFFIIPIVFLLVLFFYINNFVCYLLIFILEKFLNFLFILACFLKKLVSYETLKLNLSLNELTLVFLGIFIFFSVRSSFRKLGLMFIFIALLSYIFLERNFPNLYVSLRTKTIFISSSSLESGVTKVQRIAWQKEKEAAGIREKDYFGDSIKRHLVNNMVEIVHTNELCKEKEEGHFCLVDGKKVYFHFSSNTFKKEEENNYDLVVLFKKNVFLFPKSKKIYQIDNDQNIFIYLENNSVKVTLNHYRYDFSMFTLSRLSIYLKRSLLFNSNFKTSFIRYST